MGLRRFHAVIVEVEMVLEMSTWWCAKKSECVKIPPSMRLCNSTDPLWFVASTVLELPGASSLCNKQQKRM